MIDTFIALLSSYWWRHPQKSSSNFKTFCHKISINKWTLISNGLFLGDTGKEEVLPLTSLTWQLGSPPHIQNHKDLWNALWKLFISSFILQTRDIDSFSWGRNQIPHLWATSSTHSPTPDLLLHFLPVSNFPWAKWTSETSVTMLHERA